MVKHVMTKKDFLTAFFVSGDRIQNFFWPKMSLLVQCSVIESFKFNYKNIRIFYIKDVGQCLIFQDVYTTVGYDEENGVKTMQQLLTEKFKMRMGNAVIYMKEMDNNVHLLLTRFYWKNQASI